MPSLFRRRLATLLVLCAGGFTALGDDAGEVLKQRLLKLNRATGSNVQAAKLRGFMKDKENARKGVLLAYEMMKAAETGNKPFNYGALMTLARSARSLKQYREAEYFYESALDHSVKLESGNKLVQVFSGLIDVHWDARNFDQVIAVCERFEALKGPDEVDSYRPYIRERLIQAKAKQGKFKEALAKTDLLIRHAEVGWSFLQLKGWVLREAGEFEGAIAAYQDHIKAAESLSRLSSTEKQAIRERTSYTLSGVYADARQDDKAIEQLRMLVKQHPESADYKNDLALIMADNGLNREESERLVMEAIERDRTSQEKQKAEGMLDVVKPNPAYLDTLGWVLFKNKKFDQAIGPLRKAALDLEQGKQIATWSHYGDCLKALGLTKEAIEAWQQALTLENIAVRDPELRKHVAAKLRAEGVEPKSIGPVKPESKSFD